MIVCNYLLIMFSSLALVNSAPKISRPTVAAAALPSTTARIIRNKLVMMSPNSIGQIQGEVIVQSPPLFVKGPPKGFPLIRHKRSSSTSITRRPSSTLVDKNQLNNNRTSAVMNIATNPAAKQQQKSPVVTINTNNGQSKELILHDEQVAKHDKKKPIIGGHNKNKNKKKGNLFKKIMPYMLVPAMMGIGFAPFLLAQLKTMVMSSFMINMMALNAALFLTLRNMVFGPRNGEQIKYQNFGYHQKKHVYLLPAHLKNNTE